MQAMAETRIDPFGDLPEPLPIPEAGKVIHERDGYHYTPTDEADVGRQEQHRLGDPLERRGLADDRHGSGRRVRQVDDLDDDLVASREADRGERLTERPAAERLDELVAGYGDGGEPLFFHVRKPGAGGRANPASLRLLHRRVKACQPPIFGARMAQTAVGTFSA
jgi:hypothetical protein